MKNRLFLWGLVLGWLAVSEVGAADKIRVLLVTGGHAHDTNEFQQLFTGNPRLEVLPVAHPQAHAKWKSEAAGSYDVIVLYDMWDKISDAARADLLARLKDGKGLVAMHHSLCSYQDWPEYRAIIGGKYLLKKATLDGQERAASAYKHDVDFQVKVSPAPHPITRGLQDFTIHDETYAGVVVSTNVTPLLTTEEPTSSRTVAWAQTYAGTRVATIQLGHDRIAYANPQFRKLVAQAIDWVARKD